MQPISDAMTTTLETISERRRAFRTRQIEKYGWDPTIACAECGDTGWLPERHGRPCLSCDTGRGIDRRRRREDEWAALCPPRFREFRLDTHPNRRAVREVEDWLEVGLPRGQNLLLSGPIGTGKTGLAFSAVREAYIAGRGIKAGTVPDIMQAMRPQDPSRVPEEEASIRDLQRVPVLLLDDLGAERPTEWQMEQLYLTFDGRYQRGLPTIVTTNRDNLTERIGERSMSRFTEDLVAVAVLGDDLRRRRLQAVEKGS